MWVAIYALHGGAEAVLPVWIVFVAAVVVFAPGLMRAILPSKSVSPRPAVRLLRLAGEHKVNVRDMRCLDTRPERAARPGARAGGHPPADLRQVSGAEGVGSRIGHRQGLPCKFD